MTGRSTCAPTESERSTTPTPGTTSSPTRATSACSSCGYATPTTSSTSIRSATEQGSGVTLAARPPVGGYIPFTGTWGGGPTSYAEKALRISVPSRGYTTGFLKRGRRRSCSRYRDSVWVEPGRSLTAAQAIAVFGSATPLMPVSFRTCIRSEPGVTLGLQKIGLEIWFYGVSTP